MGYAFRSSLLFAGNVRPVVAKASGVSRGAECIAGARAGTIPFSGLVPRPWPNQVPLRTYGPDRETGQPCYMPPAQPILSGRSFKKIECLCATSPDVARRPLPSSPHLRCRPYSSVSTIFNLPFIFSIFSRPWTPSTIPQRSPPPPNLITTRIHHLPTYHSRTALCPTNPIRNTVRPTISSSPTTSPRRNPFPIPPTPSAITHLHPLPSLISRMSIWATEI